jgi:hypothetical protein
MKLHLKAHSPLIAKTMTEKKLAKAVHIFSIWVALSAFSE